MVVRPSSKAALILFTVSLTSLASVFPASKALADGFFGNLFDGPYGSAPPPPPQNTQRRQPRLSVGYRPEYYNGANQDFYPPADGYEEPRDYNPRRVDEIPEGKNPALGEFYHQLAVRMPVRVTQPQWTEDSEKLFGQFVNRLGKAVSSGKCHNVKGCFKSADANAYLANDPKSLVLYSDCGKFPHLLRSYFAYQNQLPMSVAGGLSMNRAPYASAPDRQADLKTARLDNSPYGNMINNRAASNVPSQPGSEIGFVKYIGRVIDNVSTRTFRVGPLTPGYGKSDLYPVKLDHNGIRAGTVVHTTGHVYIVWDVDNKGAIHLLDAHPDGSVTAKKVISSATLERSRPDQGLGFYRFRPLRLIGAEQINGSYYGGHVVGLDDVTLYNRGQYSLEQYFGPGSTLAPGSKVASDAWHKSFKSVDFFSYVTSKMRQTDLIVAADDEVGDLLNELCDEMQQRMEDVDLALSGKANLNQQPHPETLPSDIYTSDDETWEGYASPSRDARMKMSVLNIIKTAVLKFRQAKAGGMKITFDGTSEDYQKNILGRLTAFDQKCSVKYKKSNGASVTLPFNQVVERLTLLSFDPYDCAEKRWGASGKELQSCRDGDTGNQWYRAEQVIRNTVGKMLPSERPIIRSPEPITVDMLRDPLLVDQPETAEINLGTEKAPYLNLREVFQAPQFIKALQKSLNGN